MTYYFNMSVAKAVGILRCFSRQSPELGVTEISSRLGVSRSVVQKLVLTLRDLELLEKDPQSKRYRLSQRVVELASSFLNVSPLAREGQKTLYQLVRATHMTCVVGVIDGTEALYIASTESDASVRATSRVGDRTPLHCTSTGKCLLSFLPDDAREKLLDKLVLTRFTKNTIADRSSLETELETTRVCGYSVNREERVIGLCGVAAPVFDERATYGVAAISLAIPRASADETSLKSLGELAATAGRELSEVLRHYPSLVTETERRGEIQSM